MSTPPPFYLVWHKDGGAPTRRHPTLREAELEAERLARDFKGARFYVLAPTMSVARSVVDRERFDLEGIAKAQGDA